MHHFSITQRQMCKKITGCYDVIAATLLTTQREHYKSEREAPLHGVREGEQHKGFTKEVTFEVTREATREAQRRFFTGSFSMDKRRGGWVGQQSSRVCSAVTVIHNIPSH